MEASRRSVLTMGGAALAAPLLGWTPSVAASPRAAAVPVGVLLDVSGPTRIHGQRQLLGVQYMADRLNAQGLTVPVDLRFLDTGGTAEQATAAARELIAGGVSGLVGTSTPATLAGVAPVAEEANIPIVAPIAGDPLSWHVFRTALPTSQAATALMAEMHRVGMTEFAVLMTGDPHKPPAGITELRTLAEQHGLTIASVAVFADENDLTDVLRPLLATRPQALLVSALPPFSGLSARAARDLGWEGPLYYTPAAVHPAFFDIAGDAAEGVVAVAPWLVIAEHMPTELPHTALAREFATGFTTTHGPVGTHVGYGADAIGLLTGAFTLAGDPQSVTTVLEHMAHIGVTGVYQMTPANHKGILPGALTIIRAEHRTWAPR